LKASQVGKPTSNQSSQVHHFESSNLGNHQTMVRATNQTTVRATIKPWLGKLSTHMKGNLGSGITSLTMHGKKIHTLSMMAKKSLFLFLFLIVNK
jgi:hypothetical protein